MEYQQIAEVAQQAADIARARGLDVIVNSGPFETESPMLIVGKRGATAGLTDLALCNYVAAGRTAGDIVDVLAGNVAKAAHERRYRYACRVAREFVQRGWSARIVADATSVDAWFTRRVDALTTDELVTRSAAFEELLAAGDDPAQWAADTIASLTPPSTA